LNRSNCAAFFTISVLDELRQCRICDPNSKSLNQLSPISLGTRSQVVIRKKFSRSQLLAYTGAPDSRAQFVRRFVKSNKNDYCDAEAIAEAVERENMGFVPIKTEDQLDLRALHRCSTG
jgi:hypothetical protein